jgi:hypothetical protein
MQAETGDDSVTVVDPGVEVLVPKPGDIVLRQSQVGVDLAPGYQGTLDIDSVPMPEDQLTLNDALNQVFFQPGTGKDVEEFTPGRHCVTAHFFRTIEGPELARTFSWCFNVS